GGGGHRPHAPGRRHRGRLRLRVPAVSRRAAATRRRPRCGADRRGAGAPRRALRPPLRTERGAARPGGRWRQVLFLMLRTGLLWLSEQPRIFRFIRGNGLARRFAARFVAGETVDSGGRALQDLTRAAVTATLAV